MGLFSNLFHYREAGQAANADHVERFGEPVRSLFTSSKVLTLHHEIEITDENGKAVYRARSNFPSIHDKTDLYTADGRHVSHIERKILSIHERHFITMENGTEFELSNELFHLIRDITNIEGLGWQLRGNILGLDFELYDQNERIVAVISQKLLSLHDKYCIDIYRPEEQDTVVTILITLQHMIRDREAAGAASSGGSSDN